MATPVVRVSDVGMLAAALRPFTEKLSRMNNNALVFHSIANLYRIAQHGARFEFDRIDTGWNDRARRLPRGMFSDWRAVPHQDGGLLFIGSDNEIALEIFTDLHPWTNMAAKPDDGSKRVGTVVVTRPAMDQLRALVDFERRLDRDKLPPTSEPRLGPLRREDPLSLLVLADRDEMARAQLDRILKSQGVRDSGALPARDPGCQVRHLGPHVGETWRAQFPGFRYLVSPASVKIDKSNAAQTSYLNAVMHLAPATMAGGPNLCPCHTEGCFGEAGENCIAGTGRLEMATEVLIGRSRFFFGAPERFLERLTTEIEHFQKGARACGRKLALRLNGTSDVDWERRAGFRGLFERFPEVTFYDYTKVANRVVRGGRQIPLPKNYHLTFSLSEENDVAALEVATRTDVNIAVVFDVAPPRGDFPGGDLPKVFGGRKVIDGDKHDLRFLDPRGVVVGLRLKTLAHARREQMIMMGFVKPAGLLQLRKRVG